LAQAILARAWLGITLVADRPLRQRRRTSSVGSPRRSNAGMSNTIEFINGVGEGTSRMYLKQEMERYGRVDVCHMGNRQNPKEEPPWVRFYEPSGAETALATIKSGQVFLDGVLLQADYKSGRRAPEKHPERNQGGRMRGDLEVNSRDLFLEQERDRIRGGGRGDRDRDRKRSRSRRSRSRERDRDRRRR